MDILYWIIIGITFLVSFIALIYPILPGVLFLAAGFVIYGLAFSFEPFTPFFIIVQVLLFISLFIVDYVGNAYAVKKKGGSKAALWGSTIGLIVGPFVIPVAGILLGPFIGAVVAEMIFQRKGLKPAVSIGIGTVLAFVGTTLIKVLTQAIMIGYFYFQVL
ncbi:DUF456 domain-containing protein [Fictibacillus phosphorivorans]|uniref:Uncharacterized protein n=1 Tax=Fictibacillus phosphorivorans TaxID=1221500 RepID=A0A160IPH9_9BACL|nr:DUF456 family protein [Fictibacillus phosphorivorans]ANC77880.1 hypothetical protein ABE65_014190 [Fictibacillus phosphorivorans]MQR95569.1 DUF456 family protein [Fictibacillus phosphorivorans]